MNGMNFKPFISKLLSSLSDSELRSFYALIDSHSNNFTNRSLIQSGNLITSADKGVGLFTVQLDRDTIRTGYLVYNDSYCVLLAYVSNSEKVTEYDIDLSKMTYKVVKEFLTTDYLRHEVGLKAAVGGDVTIKAEDIDSGSAAVGSTLQADGTGGAAWVAPQEREGENVASFSSVDLSSGTATIENTNANWLLMQETELGCALQLGLSSAGSLPLGDTIELKRLSVSDSEVIFGGTFNSGALGYVITATASSSSVVVKVEELEANKVGTGATELANLTFAGTTYQVKQFAFTAIQLTED